MTVSQQIYSEIFSKISFIQSLIYRGFFQLSYRLETRRFCSSFTAIKFFLVQYNEIFIKVIFLGRGITEIDDVSFTQSIKINDGSTISEPSLWFILRLYAIALTTVTFPRNSIV